MIQFEHLQFIVRQGIKAPSGHNTQPWLFEFKDNKIEIHPNFEKSLPIVDPNNRELFISLGCAVENMVIAAYYKDYTPSVSLSENGMITITLSERNEQAIIETLYPQIAVRQTNRSVYNGCLIDDTIIKTFSNSSFEKGIHFYCYKKESQQFKIITDFILKGNLIQMSDRAFIAELKSWMRYNKKESVTKKDGLSYAVFGAPNLPHMIAKNIISSCLNPIGQNKNDLKRILSASHFILFTTKTDTLFEWINLGKELQRFLLQCTKEGIVTSFLNQPCELSELSSQLSDVLNIQNEYPTILLRIGYGKPTPYSFRIDL